MNTLSFGATLFILSYVLEVATLVAKNTRTQKIFAGAALVLGGFGCGVLLGSQAIGVTLLLPMVHIYRTVNLLRFFKARMHPAYLKLATRNTSLMLITMNTVVLSVWALREKLNLSFSTKEWFIFAAALQMVCAALILAATVNNLLRSKVTSKNSALADKSLPTISVAIPARNETEHLEKCLKSVLASDYPKLEILVLDDCSQDKTSDIIKKFAQEGVRFIKGEEALKHWLAKNQAYDALLGAASGEIIVFMGVDVRIQASTLRQLAEEFEKNSIDMISVLPHRIQGTWRESFVQPMRYFWELAWPRRLFKRPPVLSTFWAIKKDTITNLGGFKAVARQIVPEAYFSRKLSAQQKYKFARSHSDFVVSTIKPFDEQLQTALRTRYPQAHRRPQMVLFLSLAEVFILVAPFAVLAIGLLVGWTAVILLSTVACALLVLINSLIITATDPKNWWLGLLNFPFMALSDVAILNYSMWRYEFGEVDWKGRNVCLPVMHVYPSLPKLP